MKERLEMLEDIEDVLFTERQIAVMVERIGQEISRDYKGKNLLLMSSYGSGVKTSGVVKINMDLNLPLEGYDIVVVEDILDSGKTLHYLMELLEGRNPNSIRVCTLFDKPDRREVDVQASYVGSVIPDAFIVGYGLDYAEKYRNLPFVGVLKPQVYE